MKQRIKATHFIEQYNTTEAAHEFCRPEQNYTMPLHLDYLSSALGKTAQMEYRRTVAIWKIQYKPAKN